MKKSVLYILLILQLFGCVQASEHEGDKNPIPSLQTKYPFGIGVNYPTSVTQKACRNAYNDFIKHWVTDNGCVNDAYRVHIGQADVFDKTAPYDTFSEGIGWGMLISAVLDMEDLETKKYFDGFNLYRKQYQTSNGFMAWLIDKDGNIKDNGIAAEADENMAMGLVMAHYRWGSDGTINYKKEAQDLINNLMEHCVLKPQMMMRPFDTWGEDLFHPCNMNVGYYKYWAKITNDTRWNKVTESSYMLFGKIINKYKTGLLPHWCNSDGNKPTGQAEYFSDYTYEYDACQTSIKICLDYLLHGTSNSELALQIPNMQSLFIRKKALNNPENIMDGYTLDGNVTGLYAGSSSFIGAFGVASMCAKEHQNWCDGVYATLTSKSAGGNNSYYNDMIRLMSIVIMSGEFKINDN